MKNWVLGLLAAMVVVSTAKAAPELEMGEERIKPGIVFIFEGAIKDEVNPGHMHLREQDTDVHLEARVNWDEKDIPKGTPAGGFIPYLKITAKVVNQKTGKLTYVDLLPHINLVDNFHYARNMALPGERNELYDVTFYITPGDDVSLHHDWMHAHGHHILKEQEFSYKGVNFEEIANATRR